MWAIWREGEEIGVLLKMWSAHQLILSILKEIGVLFLFTYQKYLFSSWR